MQFSALSLNAFARCSLAFFLCGASSLAAIQITEFMADNNRTVADEEGDHPDWVELFNTGTESVNLAGWYLTDDPQRLDQWRFPATNLPPQRHILVYLSGKDRDIPGAPLHTSFKLSAGGDYLGVVHPDGNTIESETVSPFPPQLPDVSFGVPVTLESTPLIVEGSTARFLAPLNDALQFTWREPDADDSSWLAAKTGVGFEVTPNAPEAALLADSMVDFGGTQGINGWYYGYYNKSIDPNSSFHLLDFKQFPSEGEEYGLDNFWNGTSWKWAPLNPPWTEIGPELMVPTSATSARHEHWPVRRWISPVDGTLVIDWQMGKLVETGGGATLRLFHKAVLKDSFVIAGTDTLGTNRSVTLPGVKAGDAIDFMVGSPGLNNNNTDEGDLVMLRARISILASLDANIATSVQGAMYGKTASAWLRIPFTIDNPELYQRLLLRLRYDDGFVAWINGVEVAHDNAPTELRFDSAATASRPENLATTAVEFDLTSRLGVLQPGQNLLTIQGLNASIGDADFLISPELVANQVVLETNDFHYMLPSTPGSLNGPGNTNLGPVVVSVDHEPKEPADKEDMAITARVVRTFHDIAGVTLRWRVMYSNDVSVAMFDDGKHRDGAANDGVWGAIIPGNSHTNGQMIRWYVSAGDVRGATNSNPAYPDPKNSPRYYGTVHKDITLTNRLPVLHWFLPSPVSAADSGSGARGSVYYNGQFYDNVLFSLHGQSSASFPKHSYNVDFNRGHGFQYQEGSPRVDDINLLTTWPDKAKMRNMLAYETHRDAGFAYHFVIPIRVQRNAQFFGDWHMVEDGDEEYLDRVGLSPRGALYKMYDTFASAAPAAEKKTRKTEPNSDLAELYRGIQRSGAAKSQFLYDNVDIPGMVNYLAIMILTGNVDCCHKNYYAFRDSEGTREWKWLPWDQDLSFGRNWTGDKQYQDDKMYTDNPLRIGDNNTLISALFGDSKFVSMYNRRIRTLMDQLLQPTNTPIAERHYEKRIAELASQLAPDAELDFKKWPTWGQKQTLAQAVSLLTNTYLPGRRKYLYNLSGPGKSLPPAQAANLNLVFGEYEATPESGNADEEYIVVRNPNAVAVDVSNWKVRGDIQHTFTPGTVIPSNGSLYLSPNVVNFRARTRNPRGGQALFVQGAYRGQLSARGGEVRILQGDRVAATLTLAANPTPAQRFLRVSEIHFQPAAPPAGIPYAAEEFEFIELVNLGSEAIDLSRVRITEGIQFDFANGFNTNLVAGGTVLVVRNPAAMRARYGQGLPIAGAFVGRLDNGGERLRLEDRGEVVQDFRFPTATTPRARGGGQSIIVADASAQWDQFDSADLWEESDLSGGTPGNHASKYALWAAQHFTAAELADLNISRSGADADGDGDTNLREYRLGTNPHDPESRFGLQVTPVEGKRVLHFRAAAGRTYTVQVRSTLDGAGSGWLNFQRIPAGVERELELPQPAEDATVVQFYRLVTPALE